MTKGDYKKTVFWKRSVQNIHVTQLKILLAPERSRNPLTVII